MIKMFTFRSSMKGATIVLALLAGMVLVAASGSGVTRAQEANPPNRTINVSGSGEAFGSPDIAHVNLGVDVTNKDLSAALEQANLTMAQIVEAMSKAGIEQKDIQTANYSVYPEDRYNPETGQATGERVFHVQSTVDVTVRDITKAGAVMQAGLDAGANSVNGLSFGIDDMKALEQQARLKAVEDARSRAQQLAEAFGVKLGDPISISESVGGGPVYRTFAADAMVSSAPSPQINPGQLSVNLSLNVTFAIEG